MTDLLANYRALLGKVDTLCRSICDHWHEQIQCRAGCDSCCRLTSVLPVEAAVVAAAIATMPPQLRELLRERASQPDDDRCPLLHQGKCSVYAARPIICRTHGLPVYMKGEVEKGRVDFCRLNFSGVRSFPAPAMIDLDQLNQVLISIDLLFRRECGEEKTGRVELRTLL